MPDANTVRNANGRSAPPILEGPAWRLAFGDYAKTSVRPRLAPPAAVFLRRKRSKSRAKRPPHHRHSQPFIASECTRTNLGRPERKNDLRPRLEPNTWAALLAQLVANWPPSIRR